MRTHCDRRGFLNWSAQGLGATAALHLLLRDGVLCANTHHLAKAKRAVQITLVGGLSHVDSFDYKPELTKRHGQSLKTHSKPDVFFNQVGLLRKPDWDFQPRGRSGLWVSKLFPQIASIADELTIIRSMTSESANHTPALFVQNSGFQFNGYPALGSWLSYGLGNIADELPAFVVLPDARGEANGAASNWSNGFLPAQHQGTIFGGGDSPVSDLFPERTLTPDEEKDSRTFLTRLNALHLARAGGEAELVARMKSYDLAAKMQLAVPAVADLSRESAKVRTMYGLDEATTAPCGRRCLLARRLLERGVRFVQIYSGGPIAGSPRTSWDAHENVKENHGAEAARIDKPVAALVRDLKQRGMLDDTLVIFTTEFGRTPFAQSAANEVGPGRDHNKYAFSCWLAGAGLRPGIAFGRTDEIGWKVAEHPVSWHDFHATVLHLFGIDHEKLTFYHNGIKRRLTNVHGEVVKGILASA
jgi:hypothetical protein